MNVNHDISKLLTQVYERIYSVLYTPDFMTALPAKQVGGCILHIFSLFWLHFLLRSELWNFLNTWLFTWCETSDVYLMNMNQDISKLLIQLILTWFYEKNIHSWFRAVKKH